MFGLTPYFRKQNDIMKGNNIWDINTVFEEFFKEPFFQNSFMAANAIKADIRENDKEYIVDAEIPGVNKEDIKLELRNDTLTISVEHKVDTEEKSENYLRRERKLGSFSRSFYVQNVKNDMVTAKYNNGILTITLPKEEGKAKSNRIDIQ
ncbi:MAG TPA: Hsp20/alpha crystallin family protein [Pseudobacteroides sp.]|uniref:Hsp20/alpha crystallin family protein n=1 Tax=Pseudobacteroides sp. TaxID=1968840 RepID=UPI002F95061F